MFAIIVIGILLLLAIFTCKDWIIHYLKLLRVYGSIPCPPNRLPLLGNIFNLPLSPHGKRIVLWVFPIRIFVCRILSKIGCVLSGE